MELPKRKLQRLQNYDYSQNGAYFITICTHERNCIFGDISRDNPCGCPKMKYSQLGDIALKHINFVENNSCYDLLKFVIMPNHIHMIIVIVEKSDNKLVCSGQPQGLSLPSIIGGYKSLVACDFLRFCKSKNISMGKIWQRSYHDHIIKNEKSYQEIWQYIDTNPLKWELDCFYQKLV